MLRYSFYRRYVSVGERRAKADKKIRGLENQGFVREPLGELTSRMKIATSFWGRSWCRHLESLSDYENRLPRGRTYVRNGSVLRLAITQGKIYALVMGSELYKIDIAISTLPADKWSQIKDRCKGGIGSLIELLQGKISDEIMRVVADKDGGLFPSPNEIQLNCSCPDWAGLCKHLAAVLYGVGARLDSSPELLFLLRGVDHQELISAGADTTTLTQPGGRRRKTLDTASLSSVFGVDFSDSASVQEPPPDVPSKTAPAKKNRKPAESAKSAESAKKSPPRKPGAKPTTKSLKSIPESHKRAVRKTIEKFREKSRAKKSAPKPRSRRTRKTAG